jgi:PAS domain S-box-containing protein
MMKDQLEATGTQGAVSVPHPFETIFEQAAIGIAYVAKDGQLLHVNQHFCDITGYTHEELVQRSVQDITLPEEKKILRPFPQEYMSENVHGRSIEKRYIRKDGSLIWVSVTPSPVKGATGESEAVIIVVQDISERKRAEEERYLLEGRTQEVLNALLAIAEVLVAVPDLDNEREPRVHELEKGFVSTAASEVGRRLVELIGSVLGCKRAIIMAIEPTTDEIHPVAAFGPRPDYQAHLMGRLQNTKINNYFSDAHIERFRTGEIVFLDWRREPLGGEQQIDIRPDYEFGEVALAPLRIGDVLVGLLGLEENGVAKSNGEHPYTQDEIALIQATARLAALALEREHLLQERAEAQANTIALRAANRRMDEFLSIASHELKNPLAAIKGNVQLAERRLQSALRSWSARSSLSSQADGEAEKADLLNLFKGTLEALGIADRQVSRLNRLVGDLLDISRIQVGKMEIHFEPADLRAIVHEAVESQRMATPERVIHLIEPEVEEVPILADAGRIEQVVINYLANAARYSPQDTPIEISLSVHDGEALIEVRDEGPGLSSDQQQMIWERFHQVKDIKQQLGTTSGLGLGLYISKTIIERHHGQYGVKSTPGMGSLFWFGLPLSHESDGELV